jgi:general secretion pathway protein K
MATLNDARKSAGVASDQHGFALVAVMFVLALLAVVVTELAFSMRLETAMVRTYRDTILARHLAEAGIQQGIRELLADAGVQGLDGDGQVVFYRVAQTGAKPQPLPELPRSHVPLGPGEFSYRITDEEARLNLNMGLGQRILLDRLLTLLGVEKQQRDIIKDSLLDWRDRNDLAQINGAESDYYLQLPVPYRPRNGNLQDVSELLEIRGITPELYYGHDDTPGLVDLVTVRSRGNIINLNTAPMLILKACGLSDAEVDYILQARVSQPFGSVPPLFTARPGLRFAVRSLTFRIEAEGLIAGEPRARLHAIVRRGAQTGPAPPPLAVYSWQPLPLRPRAGEGETSDGAAKDRATKG